MRDRQQSSTSYPIPIYMVLSSDHTTAATGKTISVTLSKNGAGFGAAAGAVSEIGGGWYKLAGNATDRATLGPLLVRATEADCDDYAAEYTVVPWDPFARVLANTDQWAGTTIPAPSTAGVPLVDVVRLLGTLFTEGGAGRLVANFKTFFNVSGATGTQDSPLSAQATRDAMKLAPTAGVPAAGSVDEHLDDILGDTVDANLTLDAIDGRLPSDPADASVVAGQIAALNNLSAAQVWAHTTATTLASNVSSLVTKLAGITVLANWLRALARKDTADATALGEINSGGGGYSATTDSLQAAADSGGGSGGPIGPGAIEFPYVLTNALNDDPIPGVDVWVTTDEAGQDIVAGTLVTDAFGTVTFLLDAGTYYFWRQVSGWMFENPDQEVVS